MDRVFLTGDTHGAVQNFVNAYNAIKTVKTKDGEEKILVVLGDAGLNYYLDQRDVDKKNIISKIFSDTTILCIHGNHEARPQNIPSYKTKRWHNGLVYYEPEYPNILFAIDGFIYTLNERKCLVCGGAYSVDKYYRLEHGLNWFWDEQPDRRTKDTIRQCMDIINWNVDVVFTHTCPASYEPKEMYLGGVDQSKVDKTTEEFLEELRKNMMYKRWYCGHWHCDKEDRKVRFLFRDVIDLEEDLNMD